MKTSKVKTISRPKKASEARNVGKSQKVTINKSGPSEEETREKANDNYHERIARREHGTADDDWFKAEKLLRSSTE